MNLLNKLVSIYLKMLLQISRITLVKPATYWRQMVTALLYQRLYMHSQLMKKLFSAM